MKIKVLCFIGYYLPGYKAGGPLRTISNMTLHLKDDIEFWIVTRDRDLGDGLPYSNVRVNEWQNIYGANVYYLSPECCTVRHIARVISETPHDVLYLNSFYDPIFTIKPLLIRRFLGAATKPCVVAPRGEFSAGAASLKATKKKLYNVVSGFFELYKGVTFQASSEHEAQDIVRALRTDRARIEIATDLPGLKPHLETEPDSEAQPDAGGILKVIFLSRISPMKNLDFAINALSLTRGAIEFNIYGPIEDDNYWEECQMLFSGLPSSVSISYCGSVPPVETQRIFSQHDLFFFPTRGENYGHVIAESLSAGTPVLLSDQTPWLDLESQGLGWDMPLDSPKAFAEQIDKFAGMEPSLRRQQRTLVQTQARKLLQNPEIVKANRDLFFARLQF
ncbi:glycosyltransferase family 4 protein [Pseudomonas resinovorans]|uniref:Glycosyltransferase family 4 protein n=1 Tax=Metapseudomonas resinovorans TaxID=53412 RepID=A0ABT4YB97_METRE|nr:glycosyltransferase family 4 protein [Pseudomonas resinovorans]MDA8486166.1 glycosyltransferase family 4 protein [Pseudomonas resinovorans]